MSGIEDERQRSRVADRAANIFGDHMFRDFRTSTTEDGCYFEPAGFVVSDNDALVADWMYVLSDLNHSWNGLTCPAQMTTQTSSAKASRQLKK